MRLSFYLLLIFNLCFYKLSFAQSSNDFKFVRLKARKLLLSDTAYATEQSYRVTDDIIYNSDAAGYLKSLTPNGNWNDLDYFSQQPGSWKPIWHLYRVMLLCRAYYKTSNNVYLNAIHRALAFWIGHDFQSGNWWQNQINTPFAYSSIMIMLGKDARPEELAYLDEKLSGRMAIVNATGQNLLWQYDNQARLAIIQNNESVFSQLMKDMQKLITVSTNEGIQPDFSFQQHGQMLQFGNYGLHFLNSTVWWLGLTAGTRFAFAPGKQKLLADYCSQGLSWTVFNGAMDITAVGRQLRANYTTKRDTDLQACFSLLEKADTGRDECNYFLDGPWASKPRVYCSLDSIKNFWRSDYMIDRLSRQYMISVRTHGNGVKKVESINGENLEGAFLNDGVTLMQRTGLEYRNIEPLWNWTMLPGTTCDTLTNPASKIIFNSNNNASAFVGQVSCRNYGISCMAYSRLGISAAKTYFLLGPTMICLGTDINADDRANIVTTIDQCFNRPGQLLLSGESADHREWILHDSTLYYSLLSGQHIVRKIEQRSGRWSTIDQASGNNLVKGTIFTAFIPQSTSNQYAYGVTMNVGIKKLRDGAGLPDISLLSNSPELQAISTNNFIFAAFLEPGKLTTRNTTLSVDKPCLIIAGDINQEAKFWVADPTRKLKNVTINCQGKIYIVNFPSGMMAGSTVIYTKHSNAPDIY